jgi:hypothetical protein
MEPGMEQEVSASRNARLAEIRAAVAAECGESALTRAERPCWTRHRHELSQLDVFNRILASGERIAHLDVLSRLGLGKRRTEGRPTLYRAFAEARPV